MTERINVSTQTGDYVAVNYNNGQQHLYTAHPDTGRPDIHLDQDEFMAEQGEGLPALSREELKESAEQRKELRERRAEKAKAADEAGEPAIDPSKGDKEQVKSPELQTGEAIWRGARDQKNKGKKVTVLGPSPDLQDGIDPRNGQLYVELVTENGTPYKKVRAENLEFLGSSPLAEAVAEAKAAGEQAEREVEEAVKRLEKIIPPTEKEKRAANLTEFEKILHRFDKDNRQRDREFKKLLRSLELLVQGNKEEAQEVLSQVKYGKNEEAEDVFADAKTGVNEPSKTDQKEPEADIPEDTSSSYPLRKETEEAIENGHHIDENGHLNGKHEEVEETPESQMDKEAMDASMKRLQEIQEALASEDLSPEERVALTLELGEVLAMQREIWQKGSESPSDTPEDVLVQNEEVTEKQGKLRRAWNRMMNIVSGRAALANLNSRTAEETRIEEINKDEKSRRRYALGFLAAGVALGGIGAALADHYLFDRHGMAGPGIARHFHEHVHQHRGAGALTNGEHSHIKLNGLNPDTIHAKTPEEFHHGVAKLLERQGVHVHGMNSERMAHMTRWMQEQQVASGMREGGHGLEQNIANFPSHGHEFVNANASADQGFRLGTDGTGRAAMDAYIREAERIGVTFSRG